VGETEITVGAVAAPAAVGPVTEVSKLPTSPTIIMMVTGIEERRRARSFTFRSLTSVRSYETARSYHVLGDGKTDIGLRGVSTGMPSSEAQPERLVML
jgi:hypothetical protein